MTSTSASYRVHFRLLDSCCPDHFPSIAAFAYNAKPIQSRSMFGVSVAFSCMWLVTWKNGCCYFARLNFNFLACGQIQTTFSMLVLFASCLHFSCSVWLFVLFPIFFSFKWQRRLFSCQTAVLSIKITRDFYDLSSSHSDENMRARVIAETTSKMCVFVCCDVNIEKFKRLQWPCVHFWH